MKRMKKLFAILMTMAMVMGLSITGFAAINGGSITVSGLSTAAAQEIKVYKIFTLDENNNSWVKADWLADVNVPEDNLDDSTILNNIVAAIDENTPVIDSTTTTETNGVYASTVTLNNDIEAGAYLVMVNDTLSKVEYSPMVAITYEYNASNIMVAKGAEVVAKAESYSTDKKMNDESGDDNVVAVGDIIEYEITTTVPYVSEENNIDEFWVSDTLTNAEYYFEGEDSKFEVTLAGEPYSDFEVPNPIMTENNQQFTLFLNKLLNDQNTNAGKKVVIKYTVKVTAVDEITNKASSSNDSNEGTDEGEVKVYTGQMQITKYGELNDDGETRPVLAGAEFAVYRNTADGEREYATIDDDGYITGEWTKVAADDPAPEDVDTVITGEDGIATVKGLDVGTYYFEEIVAPDGYKLNMGAAAIAECKITKTKPDGKVTVFGETTMNNTKMASLPETGGMGTTLFTIAGCVIMISAAGLFFATRKKAN